MVKINLFLCLLFSLTVRVTGGDYDSKPLLTVYYESNCPDSKTFILHQLLPVVERLQEYLMLELIPFGKSKSIYQGRGGFECQHGPNECLGNMVQDCALNLIRHRADIQKALYVACEMDTEAGSKGNLACVKSVNLSVGKVKKCLRSGKGVELQLISESLTNIVDPKFVPTITIDGIFNQHIQDSAQNDLMGTLCTILKYTRPCEEHFNKLALNLILYSPIYIP